MKSIWDGHITRAADEMRNFCTDELTMKILYSVLKHKELEPRITEFNNNFRFTTFSKSLGFQLGRAMIKHCTPTEIIDWKIKASINEIMNNNQTDKTARETISIMNDFINEESRERMKKIMVIRDLTTPDGKILKDRPVYDFSLLESHELMHDYRSILFEKGNYGLIKHYYCDYLYYFPVTLAEFERLFFFFLTFLAAKQYPSYTEINDVYSFVKEINEIVQMRYIDINDRLIMSFLNLIDTDPELHQTCRNIYTEINEVNELTISQVFDSGS
jgi:hypothetical protein